LIKFFLALAFIYSSLLGCALCRIYQPIVAVDIELESEKEHLTRLNITWKFAKEFSTELARDFNLNANDIFEPNEVAAIQKAILDYIEPLNFLTTIKYLSADSKKYLSQIESLEIDDISYQTYFVNGLLRFGYQIGLDYRLNHEDLLFISIHDDRGFFIFKLEDEDISFENEKYQASVNSQSQAAFIKFYDAEKGAIVKEVDYFKQHGLDLFSEVQSEGIILSTLQQGLQILSDTIQSLIKEIKHEQNYFAIGAILLFSLLYGALHATGPGHGKMIVASYIFSANKSIQKALIIALLIGVVHAFSAFLLTLVVYFVVTGFLLPFVDSAAEVVTKISAIVIIFIALMLLSNKIKNHIAQKKLPKFSVHKPTCGCASCKVDSKTTDLGVILGAGAVPCPGTVVIFILALSQGLLFVGLLSAVMMSLGMGAVIFLTALLSMGVKSKFQKNQKLLMILEYGAIGLILILGSLMLIA